MFIIVRQSDKEKFDLSDAYTGSVCEWANVEPGMKYADRKSAEFDISYLQRSSKLEFQIVELD